MEGIMAVGDDKWLYCFPLHR